MIGRRCVYLVGFMCSGKSSVGRLLAESLGLPWLDLDTVIEFRVGRAIGDIFSDMGEDGFRELETECLSEVAPMGGMVVSTGGGVVTRQANVDLMRGTGSVIHLEVGPEDVLARLGDDTSRPLLRGPDHGPRVVALLTERSPLYERAAHATVSTDGRSLCEVRDGAIEALRALGGRFGVR